MGDIPAWLTGARIAPSAHNTQPWLFTPLTDGSIRVGWNEQRALPKSDPASRDLYLGLGAAVEAACLASLTEGSPFDFVPESSNMSRTVGHLVPSQKEPSQSNLTLARSLLTRHTARTPHLPRRVNPEIIQAFSQEAEQFGCCHRVVTDRDSLGQLAKLARRATAALYADPVVHAELWQWLRLQPDDRAYRRDGLTADCLELRGLTLVAARLLLPPARMRMLTRLGVHHLLAYDAQRIVQRSASICLLTVPNGDRTTLVQTGRVLLRLWLMAAAADMSTHPISALLDCAQTVGPTLDVFHACEERPACVFRLGYAPPVARSPRLPAAELVKPEP